MKKIEVDDELYQYIASRTQAIGESASDILRRLLRLPATPQPFVLVQEAMQRETNKVRSTSSKKITSTKKTIENDRNTAVERIEKILKSSEFIDETKGVTRFLMILTALYQIDPTRFGQIAEDIQGRERLYFARDESTLLASGNSIKAKQVPNSPFWVNTNNNTARKGIILVTVMQAMDLPNSLIEQVKFLFS